MYESNKNNAIHRLRVVNFDVSTDLLRKSFIDVNNPAEKNISATKHNNDDLDKQKIINVVDESTNLDIETNRTEAYLDVKESNKSASSGQNQNLTEALSKESQKPLAIQAVNEKHVRIETDRKYLKSSGNDSKGLVSLPLKRRVKRKRKRYKTFNFDDLKRSLSHHSHKYSNQIRGTLTALKQGNNNIFKSNTNRRHEKDHTTKHKNNDDVKVLFNRKASQLKTKGEVKSSWSLDDVFGFRRSNRFSNPYVYQQHRSCKPRRVKIDRLCKSCTPLQVSHAAHSNIRSNVKYSKSADSHKATKHQPLHLLKFPQNGLSRSSIKLQRKLGKSSYTFPCKKTEQLYASRVALAKCCGDAAVGDHTSLTNAAVSAENPCCAFKGDTCKKQMKHKENTVQTYLKYILFGFIAIVWAPCILVVILCWLITYPLRPQAVIRRYSGECKSSPEQQGFLSWVKSADWYNSRVCEAIASLLKGTKKSEKHPDPNKLYTLYHTGDRGWVIKPLNGDTKTTKNRAWTRNPFKDMRADPSCHRLRPVQIPPETKNWCGTCPVPNDFHRSRSCPHPWIGKQTKDGDIKLPIDIQPRRMDEQLKRSPTFPRVNKTGYEEPIRGHRKKKPSQHEFKEIYKAPTKQNKTYFRHNTEEPSVCECLPGKKKVQTTQESPMNKELKTKKKSKNLKTFKDNTEEDLVCECLPGKKETQTTQESVLDKELMRKKKRFKDNTEEPFVCECTPRKSKRSKKLKLSNDSPQYKKLKESKNRTTFNEKQYNKRTESPSQRDKRTYDKAKMKSTSPEIWKIATVKRKKKSKFPVKKYWNQFVNFDKSVWGAQQMDCKRIYIHTMKNRPCFCIYRCCPSWYPYFLNWYKCYLGCCHCFLLCLSTIFWCPPMLCFYFCVQFLCNICN